MRPSSTNSQKPNQFARDIATVESRMRSGRAHSRNFFEHNRNLSRAIARLCLGHPSED